MTVSRRLVAVFAADMEGYSRLMGADEVGTLSRVWERRGRRAVRGCGADRSRRGKLPPSPDKRISFRIGVHVGDVMVRGGDLFGDGVNIAARLQALAQPGSVCVSGATYEQVKKVLPLSFTDLGPQQVKNIEEPIRAYVAGRLGDTPSAAALANASKSPPLPDKPSIAVLPFQNMSGDALAASCSALSI